VEPARRPDIGSLRAVPVSAAPLLLFPASTLVSTAEPVDVIV
jgi:hypothetical protein